MINEKTMELIILSSKDKAEFEKKLSDIEAKEEKKRKAAEEA